MRRKNFKTPACAAYATTLVAGVLLPGAATAEDAAASLSGIVHDAEFYVLQAQHGERWAAEDEALDQKLRELRDRSMDPEPGR